MDIKYIAKSKWSEDEVMFKTDAGCDGIEYQILLPETDPFLQDDWWDELLAALAVSVHMPLEKSEKKTLRQGKQGRNIMISA